MRGLIISYLLEEKYASTFTEIIIIINYYFIVKDLKINFPPQYLISFPLSNILLQKLHTKSFTKSST